MSKRVAAVSADGRTFLGLTDHVRLPSRFYARLSATASRLRG